MGFVNKKKKKKRWSGCFSCKKTCMRKRPYVPIFVPYETGSSPPPEAPPSEGIQRTRTRRLVYCVNYFIHFLPPIFKRNAVYQSYYIHTNGHTIAVHHFVVNKSLNRVVCECVCVFFFPPSFCRGSLLLWKRGAGGQDTTAEKRNRN